jgi:hypothetical protein
MLINLVGEMKHRYAPQGINLCCLTTVTSVYYFYCLYAGLTLVSELVDIPVAELSAKQL